MLLSYHEIMDRANRGPYITEEDWDLEKVAMTTRKMVSKYKLEWDPEEIVPPAMEFHREGLSSRRGQSDR